MALYYHPNKEHPHKHYNQMAVVNYIENKKIIFFKNNINGVASFRNPSVKKEPKFLSRFLSSTITIRPEQITNRKQTNAKPHPRKSLTNVRTKFNEVKITKTA